MHARCCAEGPELRGLVVLEGTRARRDSRPAAAIRLASAAFSHLTGYPAEVPMQGIDRSGDDADGF